MLELSEVEFSYAGQRVLDQVNLKIAPGEILALLGPNGAGKSTLVSLVTGACKPAKGKVLLDGREPWHRRRVRRRIGWVPQNVTLFPRLTARENVRAVGRLLGVKRSHLTGRVDSVLQQVGLYDRRNMLAGSLSGGQQRLLNVALGLVHEPSLLVLDEPTAGVDAAARERLKRTLSELRSQGLAVLLTTHELEDADQLADQLAILVAGKVVAAGAAGDVIGQFFANNREVSVTLSGASGQGEGCGHLLDLAGLTADPDASQWRGVLANDQHQVDRLVQALLDHGALVRDLRVRSPSLELLMREVNQPGIPA